MTLLDDEEWRKWSNRKIAEVCGVSYESVRSYREAASDKLCQMGGASRLAERNGTVYEMQTANIGQRLDNWPQYDAPEDSGYGGGAHQANVRE